MTPWHDTRRRLDEYERQMAECPPDPPLKWGWWIHGVYDQPWPFVATERAVARRVRWWRDFEGLAMIVKERAKHPARPWLRALADRVIGDESWEPPVLRLLLSGQAAGLVHHLSTACVNAAVAGVWAGCVAPWPPSRIPPYARRLGMPDFEARSASTSFYNWPALSRAQTPRQVLGHRLPPFELICEEVFVKGGRVGRGAVDPDSRQQYLARFTGAEPFDTGRRIVEDLEQLVKERTP